MWGLFFCMCSSAVFDAAGSLAALVERGVYDRMS